MSNNSVSQWIDDLKRGDERAAQLIWERYYGALVRLGRKKLGSLPRRAMDEEDVALSAFDSFCRNTVDGRFPQLESRDDLWKLLFTITERKAVAHLKHETRQKRGGGKIRGNSVFVQAGESDEAGWNNAAIDRQPTPGFAAEVADSVKTLFAELNDDVLRNVAAMKMAGATNDEVATQLECSVRSVKRKLQVIRTIWSKRLDE